MIGDEPPKPGRLVREPVDLEGEDDPFAIALVELVGFPDTLDDIVAALGRGREAGALFGDRRRRPGGHQDRQRPGGEGREGDPPTRTLSRGPHDTWCSKDCPFVGYDTRSVARWTIRYMGNAIPLSKGDFVLGRGSECEVQIDDFQASRRHAVLHVDTDTVTIEDLESRNGVEVNGVRVDGTKALVHGDVIGIGKHEIHLVEEDERQRRATLTTVQSNDDSDRLAEELAGHLDADTGVVPAVSGLEKLSKREREVLRLAALGHTHKEIGQALGVTAKTVETYRSRINEKMRFSSRAELVRFALRAGLMDDA
ncbi:MAG: hypothetical protein DRJ42_11935 [Deltaproteobacteria bacterium]|nr:MAG: hypothetical protein DRJ42_11935 [Deltaproteobacteria bacterium]